MKKFLMLGFAVFCFLLISDSVCSAKIRDEQIALGGIYPGCPFSEVVRMYGEPDSTERKKIPNAHEEGTLYRYGNSAGMFVTDEGIVYYMWASKDSDLTTPDGISVGTDLGTLRSVYGKEDFYSGHNATAYGYYSNSDEIMMTCIMDHDHCVKSLHISFK